MKPVANLVIEMAANVARLEKDMSRARNSVDGAMRRIQQSVRLAMRALGALGLGIGTAQLAGFVKQAIATGDQMQKMSQQIGVATQNIAGLQMAFRQGGANASDLQSAMRRLSLGVNNQTEVYKRLGIQSKDTLGALMEIADTVQAMPDGLEKSAIANELLGRSGARLIPVLNQGSEGLRRYIDLSQQLGTAVTPEVAKQFELYNDTMDDVGEAMRGLAMQAAVALIPTLQSLAESLRNAFTDGSVQQGIEYLLEAMRLLGIAVAGRLIGSIAALTGSLITMAAGMTGAAAATGGFTVALTALKGSMALLGGPVGLIATAAGALIYFTEKAYTAETSADGLAHSLGLTNAELANMNNLQIESKIADITVEMSKLELAALEAAAELQALNDQMSDPEAYAVTGGQASSALQTINLKIEAHRQVLKKLEEQQQKNIDKDVKLGEVRVEGLIETSKATDAIAELIEKYRQETDALTMSTDEKERASFVQAMLNEGIREGSQVYREYLDLFDSARLERRTIESQMQLIEREKKANEERTAERIKAEEDFAREADRINNQIGQSLTDALMNGGKSAKEYLVDLFRTLVLRPILQPIISGALGAFGIGSAGAAIAGVPGAGGAAGGTDVMGLIGALKSGYDVLSGGFASIGSMASSATATLMGQTAAVEAVLASTSAEMMATNVAALESIGATSAAVGAAATVLAGVGAGLAAGTFISGQYSVAGDPMVATGLGTAAGLGVAALAGFGPAGLAIGALLGGAGGGLINRAFGRGPRKTQAAGVTGSLSAGGADLMAFENWSRSGGWFRSGSSGTQMRGLDDELSTYFNQQAAAVGFGVSTLAESLGQSSERIGDFSQQIRVDLLNLSDEEAQEKIAETFESFSNNLVNFLVPSVQHMTKEGETSTEALTRLATSLANVNTSFATMGVELLDLSLNTAQAASNLIDLVGGLDEFTRKSDFFYQNFYSQQERVNNLVDQTSAVFAQMGIAMPTTRDGFRELYQVIAGSGSASLTAAMLNIAPAMNEVIGYTEQLEQAERQLAATIRSERLGLEREVLETLGDTVELRSRELDVLNESNRAIQEQLYAIADAESVLSDAVSATDDAFARLEAALSSQLNTTLRELEASFNALTDSLNHQISAAQAARDVASESLSDLNSIFSLLDREISRLLQSTMTAQTASQGMAFIAQALQTAQTTGYLPDQDQLAGAISAARGGLGSEQFGSGFEQRRASLQLTNQLIQLRDITGEQTTTAERQVQLAELQLIALLDRLDQASDQYVADQQAAQDLFESQMDQAQAQIDVLRNVDDSVFGVQQAIELLGNSIDAERGSMLALQKQMIALQQEQNARDQAEAERLAAERKAEQDRIAAEAKAAEDARIRAEKRAAEEAAAAEAARIKRAEEAAKTAARIAAEEEAARKAERDKNQALLDSLTRGNPLFGGSGSSFLSYTPYRDDEYTGFGENAKGGYWGGGLSLVGEEGPELVNFARPSMIYTAGETADILSGGKSDSSVASEVRSLRTENQAQSRALVALQARMTRLLERWDGDGLPEPRFEEATT